MKVKLGAALRTSEEIDVKTYRGGGLVGHPISWEQDRWYHWMLLFTHDVLLISRDGTVFFREIPPKAVFKMGSNNFWVFIGGHPPGGFLSCKGIEYRNIQVGRVE